MGGLFVFAVVLGGVVFGSSTWGTFFGRDFFSLSFGSPTRTPFSVVLLFLVYLVLLRGLFGSPTGGPFLFVVQLGDSTSFW